MSVPTPDPRAGRGALSPDLRVPVAPPGRPRRVCGGFRDPLGPRVVRWRPLPSARPDSLPVIGPARQAPNVADAFRHGHAGPTGAPLIAERVADRLGAARAPIDPAPFLTGRF